MRAVRQGALWGEGLTVCHHRHGNTLLHTSSAFGQHSSTPVRLSDLPALFFYKGSSSGRIQRGLVPYVPIIITFLESSRSR